MKLSTILAALVLLLIGTASSGAAQLSPESESVADPVELRADAVIKFEIQAWRGETPDGGAGMATNVTAHYVDGKATLFFCNRPALDQCRSFPDFNSPIGILNAGSGTLFALPNPEASLPGRSTRFWTILYGQRDPATGTRPLVARESREVTFVAQAPTPEPTPEPTPAPTPPWRVTSDLSQ